MHARAHAHSKQIVIVVIPYKSASPRTNQLQPFTMHPQPPSHWGNRLRDLDYPLFLCDTAIFKIYEIVSVTQPTPHCAPISTYSTLGECGHSTAHFMGGSRG